MGFLYFIGALIGSALTWFIFIKGSRIMTPNDINYDASKLENADKLDFAILARGLDTYVNAINTLNIRRLYNILSDSFFHQVSEEVQGLQKSGIRREINIVPLGGLEDGILTTDGKFRWCTATLHCQYTEKYIDITTNQVLHTIHYSSAQIMFQLSRSDHRIKGKEILCINCGSPVGANGEVYICNACGASYTSDSYDWTINGIRVTNKQVHKTDPVLTYTMYYVMATTVLLPILGFFAGNRPGLAIFILIGTLINLSIVTGFVWWVYNVAAKGVIELRTIDPLSSYIKLDSRIGYLITLFYTAMNYNPYIIKPFMEQQAFNELLQNYNPSGNRVLNIEYPGGGSIVSGIKKYAGRDYIETINKAIITVLDNQRRVIQIKKKIKFLICRRENVVTNLKSNPEIFICPNCGASINLTADGKCRFCGADTDLSYVDWILGRVDSSTLV